MYPNTYSSIIIPIFVLIQFCNNIFIFTSHHPFIFKFVSIQFCNIILIFTSHQPFILSIFSKIITDTELIFSVYTIITTSYPKIYHTSS